MNTVLISWDVNYMYLTGENHLTLNFRHGHQTVYENSHQVNGMQLVFKHKTTSCFLQFGKDSEAFVWGQAGCNHRTAELGRCQDHLLTSTCV